MLDSKDTLVVIGTTWSTRYSVSFENITANITPVDLVGQNKHKDVKTNFEDKIRQDRRISSPYTIDKTELNKLYNKFYKNGDWSLPTEKKKTSHLSAMNQFPVTVEEEVIGKMLPSTNKRDLTPPEFKPVLDDNHDAGHPN